MKALILFTCVFALALSQRPNDGTLRDCPALSQEDREELLNCPCPIERDDEGCPDCPDECESRCPVRDNCELVCLNGFMEDDNGCTLCMCRQTGGDEPDTVDDLRERGCHPDCIEFMRGSITCDQSCNSTRVHQDDYDECDLETRPCNDDERCAILGDGNIRRCVGLPGDNEECSNYDPIDDGNERLVDRDDEDDDDDEEEENVRRASNEGANDRFLATYLMESVNECQRGFTCDTEQRRCEAANGPCTRAVGAGETTLDRCDEDGNYDVRRCSMRQDDGRRYGCWCVHPNTGMQVPGTMRDVDDPRDFDRTDCLQRVYRNCTVTRGNRAYYIHHGDTVVRDTASGCQVCRCDNGSAVRCTDRECREEPDNRDEQGCRNCSSMPRLPVCGPDGRTYPSRCAAMRCGGFSADEISRRPCPSTDVCDLYPCRPGYVCVRTSGVSCTGRCQPNELRVCVNRTTLRCPANTTVGGDQVVCGSNGRSYRSFCHMIKLGPLNVRVRHRGRCDNTDCTGAAMVCGTDRVTYGNQCEMRTLTANARMDHEGPCESDDSGAMTDDELCERTRDNDRCPNMDCRNRVMPREGCCPVCGGITTITMDNQRLTGRKDGSGERLDVDDIMGRFREYDLISDRVYERCDVSGTITTTTRETNLEVAFAAKQPDEDSEFCMMTSEELADSLNSDSAAVMLPDITSYASATVAAPLIVDSGAPPLTSSLVALMVTAILAAAALLF